MTVRKKVAKFHCMWNHGESFWRGITHVADAVSVGAIFGALAGILPPLAAMAALAYHLIKIWESKTSRKYRRLRRMRRLRR